MTTAEIIKCWKCSATLPPLRGPWRRPWPRRAECPHCHIDVHVCKMCQHFTPHLLDRCDEPLAEHPRDLERANFCDYFSAKPSAAPNAAKIEGAKSQLDALFGSANSKQDSAPDAARERLESLFKRGDNDKNGD